MSKSKGSPRKFAEKIALLNKKEAEGTAEFFRIIEEVKESTRGPAPPPVYQRHHLHCKQNHVPKQYWGLPTRSSSFSSRRASTHQLPHHYHHPPPIDSHRNSQYYVDQNNYRTKNQVQQFECSPQTATTLYINQTPARHQATYIDHESQHAQQIQQHRPHCQQQLQQPQQHDNQFQHRTIVSTNQEIVCDGPVRSPTIDVPNIEIFSIEDDANYLQVPELRSTANTHLSNGHYRSDGSAPLISSSRSLPNIANLSVSQTSLNSSINSVNQSATQTLSGPRLIPQAISANNVNQPTNSEMISLFPTPSENSPESTYTNHSSQNNGYFANEDYCSLPEIQEPMPTINRHEPGGQSQSHSPISNGAWQQVATSSAPCSAAPTPPSGAIESSVYDTSHQSIQSPNSSTSQQHSPTSNHLHQDYFSTTNQPDQLTPTLMMRSNSTTIVNKYSNGDLLEANTTTTTDNGLSKSYEPQYTYIENYVTNEDYSETTIGPVANGVGGTTNYEQMSAAESSIRTPNPLYRSHSANEIDQTLQQNDCKQTAHYSDQLDQQHQQRQDQQHSQFLDTPQFNQFYR